LETKEGFLKTLHEDGPMLEKIQNEHIRDLGKAV
jgi:hypothetical protein